MSALEDFKAHLASCPTCKDARLAPNLCLDGYRLWEAAQCNEDQPADRTRKP